MITSSLTNEYVMREALKEAQKAFDADEVPIGAVIVCNNRIIARAHNLTERLNDATAHAEMQAFTSAENFLGSKVLDECILYVTIEPCMMCAGASYWTRIKKIYYGAKDEKKGFLSSFHAKSTAAQRAKTLKMVSANVLHPKTTCEGGLLEAECAELMQRFFRKKR